MQKKNGFFLRKLFYEEYFMKKDLNKGYIALLGWSLNAIEAADKFDRRYVVVAPD
jgi:hypothetical protein